MKIHSKINIKTVFFLLLLICGKHNISIAQDLSFKWENDSIALSFLKEEKLYKLEFNLDKYSVNGRENQKYYEFITPCAKYPMSKIFEKAFNTEAAGRIMAKYSTDESYIYTYQIKITPISYGTTKLTFRDVNYDYFYVKGDYLIEIYDWKHTEPLYTLKLSNLTNKNPVSTSARFGKYSNDMDEEINANLSSAGTETCKYLMKLIKNSPKVKKTQ
ncbi:MAG: hypothetical protein C0448_14540 [Sphingobacteriaceae bacterium]|nr:hypothetical protein [Sphingobacteriaceae bacterium]